MFARVLPIKLRLPNPPDQEEAAAENGQGNPDAAEPPQPHPAPNATADGKVKSEATDPATSKHPFKACEVVDLDSDGDGSDVMGLGAPEAPTATRPL